MRRFWPIAALLVVASVRSPAASAAQQTLSPEVREAASHLTKTIGVTDMMLQLLELGKHGIITGIAQQNPKADGRRAFDDIIMPELRKRSGELTDLVVDIWAAHFNLAELQQMQAFYETPLGQKSLRELPMVMQAAQEAGSKWGGETFQAILKERAADLRALGVDVPK